MRIFRLLMVCLLLHVKLYAQQTKSITLSVRNVPLETVLSEIKKQAGVSFFYKKEVLKARGKVSIKATNAELKEVLSQCFEDTDIVYTVVGNIVTLAVKAKKDKTGEKHSGNEAGSQESIQGMIYNSRGERLAGANVIVKRTHQGTITNAGGEFKLANVFTSDTLLVSYMGYNHKQLPVAGQSPIIVRLEESDNKLDAVEIQAYGSTTKRLAIGEINQINAKDIERQPVTNVLMALKSMVPGLIITPTTGFSNSPVKVEVRGRNSINPSSVSDPLYVIDGVPFIDANLKASGNSTGLQQAGFTYSGGQSPFANINPNDIESITVLKDAAATAMYGSRAGNGVIIINTKKGKPGKTKLDISASQNINQVIGHHDMLNTTQYLQMRNEALRNDGRTPSIGSAADIVAWDNNRNVDWQRELWRSAYSNAVVATLSGGADLTTFRISGSYNAGKDVSPLKDANTNNSTNLSLSLNHRSLNGKLSVDLAANYGHSKADQVGSAQAATLAPNLPSIYDSKGSLNYADWNAVNLGDAFPFSSLKAPSRSSSDLLNGSIKIGYQIINGLNVSTLLGYNLGLNQTRFMTTIASLNPLNNPTGQTNFGSSRSDGFNITPQIDYSRYLGKGKLTAIIGGNYNSSEASGLSTLALGYTSDKLAMSVNNAASTKSTQDYAQSKYIDVHGSLNYIWDNKYIFEVSASRDGSSNFGPGRQFGVFGVAGLGWIASEEKWIKKALPKWVSLIKLKASYGSTGTYPNIAYQYLSQWSVNSSGSSSSSPLNGYNGIVPQVPMHAVNQDYHWETVKQLNTAIDFAFLDDRIALHAAYYRKRSDNQLADLPTPIFTGFASVFGNSAANVQNSGIEISLNARLVNKDTFSWSSIVNFSQNRNKLLAFPGIEYTPYYTTRKIGESLSTRYLFHYKGVDSQTGMRSYEDFDGDGFIRTASNFSQGPNGGDRWISIDLAPKFETSIINQLNYKSLSLVFHFAYRKIMVAAPYTATAGTFNNNIPLEVFNNHWQKPGDVSQYPRFTTVVNGDSQFSDSDGAYTDGSYLRLQNLAISYALVPKLIKKFGLQRMSMMLSMQNVFTISKYPGIDPELPFGVQPQAKIFNGQLLFTF